MEFRNLGRTGLKVSPVCLGTMLFGDATDSDTAGRMIERCREVGINFIDTAESYAGGQSERITGRHIGRDREDWVVATKTGASYGPGPNRGHLNRKSMFAAIDASLARLDMDYVDIYYLHHPDADTPLEESLDAMGDIVAEGKARYWGFSNFRGWEVVEIVRLCDDLSVPRPVICQPLYNAVNRAPEIDVLPACLHHGIGVVPYSPIARGVLTGKYKPGKAPPTGSRAGRGDKIIMATEYHEDSMVIAQNIHKHARKRGMTAAQFAYLWVLNSAAVPSAIAGPRTIEQLDDYIGAIDRDFTAEDEALIDSLVLPGEASTPGRVHPRYPIDGRHPRTGPSGA